MSDKGIVVKVHQIKSRDSRVIIWGDVKQIAYLLSLEEWGRLKYFKMGFHRVEVE